VIKIRVEDALIRHLAELLEETGLTEIELGSGRDRIRVVRGAMLGDTNAALAPGAVSRGVVDPVATGSQQASLNIDHPGAVVSPMVGTVYLAPEPGAKPFVSVGDEIHAGDTMFIIEAMKTMNPVEAPKDGRVEEVLVANGSPVEYGEVLALLE
jgi:acetyl-CoA carboxylase biotin carboxyl carrier protein